MSDLMILITVFGSIIFATAILIFSLWLVMRRPRCTEPKHHWSNWQVCDTRSSDFGTTKVTQHRICKHCGYVQFNRSTLN